MQQPDLLQDRFDSWGWGKCLPELYEIKRERAHCSQELAAVTHNNRPFKNVFTDCTRALNTLYLVSLYCEGARKLSLSNKYRYLRPFFAILPN